MSKKILRSPILWSSGEFVVIFVVELIIIKTLDLQEKAYHATVLAAAFWLFLSLLGFYHHLDERIAQFEASSLGNLRPIWATEAFAGLAAALLKLISMYPKIEHPLLRVMAERDLSNSMNGIDFDEERSSEITHEDFGFAVENYVKKNVQSVRAFSRSTVTNWDKWYPAGQAYFNAQKGKIVTRIFVLKDEVEYKKFAEKILPTHAQEFGGDNILICSHLAVNDWIRALPNLNRIEDDEDFAIFDENIVAFCKNSKVRMRVDNLARCSKVFEVVSQYARDLKQSYTELNSGITKVDQVFKIS